MTEDLAARVQRLEDIEAIKRLKYRYCYYGDQKQFDKFMSVFASECSVDLGLGRVAATRQEVEALFRKSQSIITFANHMVHNPLIDVDGDTATGVWYYEVPNTRNGVATWTQGRYDEIYVRENGDWKIKREVLTMSYVTPFDQGWVKQKVTEGLVEKYAELQTSPPKQ